MKEPTDEFVELGYGRGLCCLSVCGGDRNNVRSSSEMSVVLTVIRVMFAP